MRDTAGLAKFALICSAVIGAGAGSPASAQDVVGDWGGLLAASLRIVIHVTTGSDGKLVGKLESVDQGDTTVPIEAITTGDNGFSFAAPTINGHYTGKWDADKQAWIGTWSQGQGLPLVLTRVADKAAVAALKPARPQEEAIARGPRPYTDQPVTFPSTAPGVTLAGTLSRPPGPGPFPAVVLIAGSGPNNRDEDVLGHKVFLVLGDALARRGIAVLRYDKRGIGQSTGDYTRATVSDFADDADAAASYLARQPRIDAKRLGLLGHSEGGLIAPMVANRRSDIAFVVLLAAPALRGDRLLERQGTLIGKAMGKTDAQIDKQMAFNRAHYPALIEARDDAAAQGAVQAYIDDAVARQIIPATTAGQMAKVLSSPWFRSFLAYDPAPALSSLTVPTLALNGSLDLQVPAADDLPVMRALLKDNHQARIVELAGLNHLFQRAQTGSPAEYGRITQTFDPDALDTVATWIVQTK